MTEDDLRLEGDALVWTDPRRGRCEVKLALVRELAIEARPGEAHRLVIFGKPGQAPIDAPLGQGGMEALIVRLRSFPQFDADTFARASTEAGPGRWPVLRRAPPINARLVSGPGATAGGRRSLDQDLALGFRHRELRERLAWRTSLAEIVSRLPGAADPERPFAHRIGPVLLGDLEIDELFATRQRPDVPLRNWEAEVVLVQDGWRRNEASLVDHFNSLLGAPDETRPFHQANESTTGWTRDNITLSIGYKGATTMSAEAGSCTVRLINNRPYPEFLTDPYCDFVRPSDVVARCFHVPGLKTSGDYRISPEVRVTPAGLLDLFAGEEHMLVWRDKDGGRIGLADRNYAYIYPASSVEGIKLQRARPERSAAASNLSVVLRGQRQRASAPSAGFSSFDGVLGLIGETLEVTTALLPDYIE